MSWAQDLFHFYKNLNPPKSLPQDIEWLYPQQDPYVLTIVKSFLDKYYDDTDQRVLMLGINPGRFGAGVTGVNFTAPRQLTNYCGIEHNFKPQSELSAEFIYDMITAYGGVKKFYHHCFIGSVCPLGFVKNGKNINYYDDRELLLTVKPFIIKQIEKLAALNFSRETCLCIGGEKNYRFLTSLNDEYQWFENIIPLAHPRFIMQYRRKEKQQFIDQYVQFITKSVNRLGQ
ncbi:MAG TPA: uracil-DNA glycosylase family protein [Chitinophagaceae bacterium]